MKIENLLDQIKCETDIWKSPIHGLDHWNRVKENGLMVATNNGGDMQVVCYFAILHDCQRLNEFEDPGHGPLAAIYAKKNRKNIDLDDAQFNLLEIACSQHTYAHPSEHNQINSTLAACWDGDRLDIGRVGIKVDADYLFSRFAKELILGLNSSRP